MLVRIQNSSFIVTKPSRASTQELEMTKSRSSLQICLTMLCSIVRNYSAKQDVYVARLHIVPALEMFHSDVRLQFVSIFYIRETSITWLSHSCLPNQESFVCLQSICIIQSAHLEFSNKISFGSQPDSDEDITMRVVLSWNRLPLPKLSV